MNKSARARLPFTGASMAVWDEKHLRAATRAAGVALWSWNVDTDAITMDESAYDLWEVAKSEREITFEILSKNIHPAVLERVRSAFAATRAIVGAYEIDFRILSRNDIRWISARGQGDDADIADRIMFGIFLDLGFPSFGSTLPPRARKRAPGALAELLASAQMEQFSRPLRRGGDRLNRQRPAEDAKRGTGLLKAPG